MACDVSPVAMFTFYSQRFVLIILINSKTRKLEASARDIITLLVEVRNRMYKKIFS